MIKTQSILLLVSLCCLLSLRAQNRMIRTYGGENDEHALAVLESRKGGYLLAGYTRSFGAGGSDIWLMRLDRRGREKWRRYFGEAGLDWVNDMIETRDGNIVLAGYSRDAESRQKDAWLMQLNRKGELMWSRKMGGSLSDEARALIQTADGGYAVAGYTRSFGSGQSDIWLLRLDATGLTLWEHRFGGPGSEQAYALAETTDGDFILAGYQAFDDESKAEMLLLRIGSDGKGIWKRVFPNTGNDVLNSLQLLPGGEILASGWMSTAAGGKLDAALLKASAEGELQWLQSYGSTDKDAFYGMRRAPGGDIFLIGQSNSPDGDADLWLVKCDPAGELIWERRFGGASDDYGHALDLDSDGGILLAGGTRSRGAGGSDMWLIKTDAEGISTEEAEVQAVPAMSTDPTRPSHSKPNLQLLSIGISEYEDTRMTLSFAHADARAFAERFRSQEGELYGVVTDRLLLNDAASLATIRRELSAFREDIAEADLMVLFISAHGALDGEGRFYLLPTDYDPENLFGTGLNFRELIAGINELPCKKLIFLDACHSGRSGGNLLNFSAAKATEVNPIVEELTINYQNLTIMTSSSGDGFSFENPAWGQGAFTKAILEGLDGKADFNGNGVIELLELNLYVTDRVSELTGGLQRPYTPINLFGNIPLYKLKP